MIGLDDLPDELIVNAGSVEHSDASGYFDCATSIWPASTGSLANCSNATTAMCAPQQNRFYRTGTLYRLMKKCGLNGQRQLSLTGPLVPRATKRVASRAIFRCDLKARGLPLLATAAT